MAIIAVCLIHTLFSWQARSMYDSSNIEYTWVHKSGVVIPYTGHSLGNSALTQALPLPLRSSRFHQRSLPAPWPRECKPPAGWEEALAGWGWEAC